MVPIFRVESSPNKVLGPIVKDHTLDTHEDLKSHYAVLTSSLRLQDSQSITKVTRQQLNVSYSLPSRHVSPYFKASGIVFVSTSLDKKAQFSVAQSYTLLHNQIIAQFVTPQVDVCFYKLNQTRCLFNKQFSSRLKIKLEHSISFKKSLPIFKKDKLLQTFYSKQFVECTKLATNSRRW